MNVNNIIPFKKVITFNFFTRLSIARLANPSDSPPCRWHIRLCTILRHASADVGAFDVMAVISCAENVMQDICNTSDIETWQVTTRNEMLWPQLRTLNSSYAYFKLMSVAEKIPLFLNITVLMSYHIYNKKI